MFKIKLVYHFAPFCDEDSIRVVDVITQTSRCYYTHKKSVPVSENVLACVCYKQPNSVLVN